jgi:hypothetical protein
MRAAVRAVIPALAVLLTTAPTAQAAVQRPVRAVHVAYHGSLPARPVAAPSHPVPLRPFYFTGSQQDEANKLAGSPTASFAAKRPTGTQSVEQVSSPLYGLDSPSWNERFSAFWSGAYRGRIVGDVRLTTYWSSLNPLQQVASPPVEVFVWADPTPSGHARLIGHVQTKLKTGAQPVLNRTTIPVSGTATRSLAVQVTTQYADVGEDLRVSYGSADAPSGFAVPIKSQPAATVAAPHNVAVHYRGPRLELQSAPIGTQAGEPMIGVTRRGVAFVDGGSLTVDTPVVEGGFTPDVRRSTDDGRHWTSVQPRLPSGTAEPPSSLDPYLYVDPATDRVFSLNLYVGCSYLSYSDDLGRSWQTNPVACGVPVDDHPTIAAGRPPAGVATSGYPNVLYYCVNQSIQTACGRSLDGGKTVTPLTALPFDAFSGCGGLMGQVVTDKSGRVLLPTGGCGYPALAISQDGGMSWKTEIVSTMPVASTQTAVAADNAGNLYYVWWDQAHQLPYLSRSTDHGKTWSAPLMIAPPGVRHVNFPAIAAGKRGSIAIVFPGTTHDPPAPPATSLNDPIHFIFGPPNNDFRPWNYYVVTSTNALSRNPLFVASTGNDPSDPINRGTCGDATGRCGLMFDFLDVQIDSYGAVWGTAVDTCTHSQGRSGVDCVKRTKATPDGNTGSDSNVGVVVKQIGGARLR